MKPAYKKIAYWSIIGFNILAIILDLAWMEFSDLSWETNRETYRAVSMHAMFIGLMADQLLILRKRQES